jgi:mono/diheme cytochrome c family protein
MFSARFPQLPAAAIAALTATTVVASAARQTPQDSSHRAGVRPATVAAEGAAASARALLNTYCIGCHNERLKTANLVLENADLTDIAAGAETWEKVLRKVKTGAMPPMNAARPDGAAVDTFIGWVQDSLERAAAARPNPGRPAIHRLNRAEYANAIRDLLGLEIDSRALLPTDDAGYGFDNIADVLSVSPGLFERYMSAARKISRLAVGDPATKPAIETYAAPKYFVQSDRADERLPFGSRGGIAIRHYFPLDGEYSLKVRLQRTWRDEIRGIAEPHQLQVRVDRALVKSFSVGGDGPRATWLPGQAVPNPTEYELNADADLEVRFAAKAGERIVGITFVKQVAEEEGFLRPNLPVTSFEFAGNRDGEPAIDTVQVAGPYEAAGAGDTPSRRRIFMCRPTAPSRRSSPETRASEDGCATRIVRTLARRAFRRPATDAGLQPLLDIYRSGREREDFDGGIELALRRILVSPEFLFRIERDPANVAPGAPYALGDLELASRLSFFLWSSIPDDELLSAAERGKLKDPAALAQQVKRMLVDPRSTSLVTNFAGQWLYLRNMRTHAPDPSAFPDFDDNLREGFQRETELFIEALLRDDRSILDLLTANFTFLNERLARHYGIAGIYGSHFRRVTFDDDSRGGLLGQGSVLTVTSYPTRTSPVLRGKWLLENILGTPPPPPPPNVPALKDTGESGKPASVRERMEVHRKNPVCASCHARMDPLGFALENFDGVGRWRTTDEGDTSIDASGVLPDGTTFQGVAGLRKALLAHRDEFASTVAEKLLTYALGRGLEYYDQPAVRRIVKDAAADDYRWSSVILGVVKSAPFQMRLRSDAAPADMKKAQH